MTQGNKTAAGPKLTLTIEEAAAELRVSRSTMFTLIREKKVRSVLIGPQIRRVPRSEIEAYLAGLLAEQSGESAPGAA